MPSPAEGASGAPQEFDPSQSPYPQALEQWRARHELWADRHIYESLEPHIGPAIKALRDHSVLAPDGVTTLVDLLTEGAAATTVPYSHEAFQETAEKIEKALAAETPDERDEELDLALQDADSTIHAVVEQCETRAFGVPGVPEAFAREVLVDSPLFDKDPIAEEDLEALLDFKDSPATDEGPGRNRAVKLSQFGRVLYYLHQTITPEGIKLVMFEEQIDWLHGKTPHDVIDTGTAEENEMLLNHVVGLLGTTAS